MRFNQERKESMGEDKRIIVKKKLKLDYEKESSCSFP